MKTLKIPEATITRLSVYSRFLSQVDQKGIVTISSVEIADGVGVSPAQVRKDLAYFGEFGTRGVGYNVQDLHMHILKILGLAQDWTVVIVGAGHLGSALTMYNGFRGRGFRIVALFDQDPAKIGSEYNGAPVLPMDKLKDIVQSKKVDIGMVAVPAEHAQDVADSLVDAGVAAILNFAPRVLSVPNNIEVRNVDLSVNLEILTFNLVFNRDYQKA